MSQRDTDKALAAQERSQETKSFVRTVKAATRRKYTPEEKIRIVLEGFRREVTVNDLCRREGIKPHSYYSWTKEFMEAGKEKLTRTGYPFHQSPLPGRPGRTAWELRHRRVSRSRSSLLTRWRRCRHHHCTALRNGSGK